MTLKHSFNFCIFNKRRWLFNYAFLRDWKYLLSLPYCSCFQFALYHHCPSYQNSRLSEADFMSFIEHSDNWTFVKETDYRYNLAHSEGKNYRDMFIKHAFKEFDPSFYYSCCDKNKTPDPGRMYFALLQYCYPPEKKPSTKEKYFYSNMNRAINWVFRKFDRVDTLDLETAIFKMPKDTSAGFVSMKYFDGKKKKKSECLPEIRKQYHENQYRIRNGLPINDYTTFAMRGHLSDRLLKKTRPVWLVSGSVIASELRFYHGFYDQINKKDFFRGMWITGENSMPRLNKYLTSNPDHFFYNTDISGWDSYKAAWFHERVLKELGKKINFKSRNDRLEWESNCKNAIYTQVLFPNGLVYKKKSGIISGYAGTLLVNCLLNTLGIMTIMGMMNELDLDTMDGLQPVNKIISPSWLGDDFGFFYAHGNFDLQRFSDMYFKWFGCTIKPEKTIVAKDLDKRKFLGYQLKGGFLYRETKEFMQSLLYMERPMSKEYQFQISFSRFFSYLLLGGVNDYYILEFFYFYLGRYQKLVEQSDFEFHLAKDNVFKLLKDVWKVHIPSFNLETFKRMSTELMKYVLLYGYDFKFNDLIAY